MMSSLNLSTLEERRNNSKITTMYKIINGNLSIPTNVFISNHCPSREGYYKQLDTMIDSNKVSFSLLQSDSCPYGRFPSIRHNEVKDLYIYIYLLMYKLNHEYIRTYVVSYLFTNLYNY